MAVVWLPTDLTTEASVGGQQGTQPKAHAVSWVLRGSPAGQD